MKVDLVFDEEGDWMGLYVDDKLVDEGHAMSAQMILRCLNISFTAHTVLVDMYCEKDLEDMLKRTVQ